MYTNPTHTAKERDEKYFEISKRYGLNSVDTSGLEEGIGMSWAATLHYFQVPFYTIEYSMSMLGALQILENYQKHPEQAVESFKNGASADYNQSIAAIYEETGIRFDFSEQSVKRMGEFLENVWYGISINIKMGSVSWSAQLANTGTGMELLSFRMVSCVPTTGS